MRLRQFPRSIPGQWLTTFTCIGLIIAPFGCETVCVLDDCGGASADVGWFINADKASEILLGAKAAGGASLLAYGTWTPNGQLGEITAILLTAADGSESFITLESGRPVHLQTADGSYAHITYNEVSAERLAWTLELYDAAKQTTEQFSGEVDLQKALADAVAELQRVTGITLPVLPAPADPAARGNTADQQVVYYPVFLVPFVALAYLISHIATQITTLVFAVAAHAIRNLVAAVFLPVRLLAEITDGALHSPLYFITLNLVFDRLPPKPRIVINL